MNLQQKFNEISPIREDDRKRLYLNPVRVVWSQGDITNVEALFKRTDGQVPLTSAAERCTLKNEKGKPHAAILLDYGREIHGSLRILTLRGLTRVRIRLGESVMEALAPLGHKNTTNDHAIRDFEMDCPSLGYHDTGESGFRFAYIEFLHDEGEMLLRAAEAVFIYRDLDYIGSFECNDEKINKIFDTAAYTAHVNMQEHLWDGIKRDRLVWIGDMHTEVLTICNVFGPHGVIPKSLDHVRNHTPVGKWMNGISSYSLWWIMCHYDYYMYSGDYSYLCQQKDYLFALLEILCTLVDENGVEHMPEKRFIDWPNEANDGAKHAGLQALLCMALENGAILAEKIGGSELAGACREKAALLKTHIPDPCGSKQAASVLALSGIGDAKKLDKELISVNGAHGYSTFFAYYTLAAKAMADNTAEAVSHMKDYYGAMLDLGATTFWEDFNLDWTKNAAGIDEIVPEGKDDIHGDFGAHCYVKFRHSLCHGWSSGPVPFLIRHVLGIKVLEPGCTKIEIKPDLAGLEFAKGTFPTPYGVIKVYVDKNGAKIDAPKAIEIVR